jgi:hypothetical protein
MLTNIFPGNCFNNRFSSRLKSATFTAELGRPLARMISSIALSSPAFKAFNTFCSLSENSRAGRTPVSLTDGGKISAGFLVQTKGLGFLLFMRRERHACHDAIADWKALLIRRTIEGKLRDDRAIRRDALEQLRILWRENQIDAGAQHRNRAALRCRNVSSSASRPSPRRFYP